MKEYDTGATFEAVPSSAWRTASRCINSQSDACVQVAVMPDGAVALGDTKAPGTAYRFTPDEWSAFLSGAKAGEFDLPA